MMQAVHIERLRALYAMVAGIPEERIELETWRSRIVKPYDPNWSKEVTNKDLLSQDCGTLACAVGWACAHPEFQKQGLRWVAWGITGNAYAVQASPFQLMLGHVLPPRYSALVSANGGSIQVIELEIDDCDD